MEGIEWNLSVLDTSLHEYDYVGHVHIPVAVCINFN